MPKSRVVVAMSGGVDSSVAAALLAKEGYEVVGVTMRLSGNYDSNRPPGSRGCCTEEDAEDARRVCQLIGARHYILNLEREFQAYVIDYFCQEYKRGRTPHPCLACNDKIKFDFLLKRAAFLEASYISTGHYARIVHDAGRWRLLKGIAPHKDQSYVLYTLTQEQMGYLLLPIGWYPKNQIREIATDLGLPVATKPDSQEICFIPDGKYRDFLSQRIQPQTGDIVATDGRVLGSHSGIEFFTVGQRRGLGLSTSEPLYVLAIDPESATVTVGQRHELAREVFWTSSMSYITGKPPQSSLTVNAKIRYTSPEVPATLTPHNEWADVQFHLPQYAITPGQAAVFYQGEEVLGGGIIETSLSPEHVSHPTGTTYLAGNPA